MEYQNNEEIIYSLSIEDIQNVAEQELERKLSNKEIESLIDIIAESIPWYDAISNAIMTKIKE